MTPVKSSNIAALWHDPINLTMLVQFMTGVTYSYANVSVDMYNQILKADSVGSAFHKLIKSQPNKHPFTKVP